MPTSNAIRGTVYSLSTSLTEARAAKFSNDQGARDLFIRDAGLQGFGLKISKKNSKSFFIEAREARTGNPRRIVIGQYPFMTVQKAREKALDALRALKYGNGAGSATSDCVPLQSLAEVFISDKESVLRPRTIEDYRMVVRAGYFQPWMKRDVRSIARKEIIDRYKLLCTERGIGAANKSMRVLSSMLNHGKAIYPSLENWSNPVRVLAETRTRIQLKPKTRFIAPDQLAAWSNALHRYVGEARSHLESVRRTDIRLLFNLMLMTGLRSNEGRSLEWSDIDLTKGTLTIPGNVAKNHVEAVLPLNSWLIYELEARKSSRSGTYVFECPEADGPMRNLRRPITRLSKISGIPFTPHDLRRSFATYLDVIGAPFGVIKQLLNHKARGDITETYIQMRTVDGLRVYSERVLNLIQRQIEANA